MPTKPRVQSAIIWLDGFPAKWDGFPARAGLDIERREFVIERNVDTATRVVLPFGAAAQLVAAGNAANGHSATHAPEKSP